ncbi:MAG: BACON domain-containing protein [Bacteroidales bacterium]|nr:BACON domain-containing protein [Bacteroidales bacterium]MBO7764786.1 BACON domain-containing protein [Bacteroidales bacterium]
MRKLRILLSAVVVVLSLIGLSGCKHTNIYDQPEKLEANTTLVSIPASGGIANVVLDVNRDWASKVKFKGESKNWLIVTPDKGAATVNTTPIQLSADTNDGKDREADVIISIGSKTLTIVVTQRGMEGE